MKDLLGNEITDPFYIDILQRIDKLKKRNKGRKHFYEENKKELDAISEELESHWRILKEEIDNISVSEQARRIKVNLGKIRTGLFE